MYTVWWVWTCAFTMLYHDSRIVKRSIPHQLLKHLSVFLLFCGKLTYHKIVFLNHFLSVYYPIVSWMNYAAQQIVGTYSAYVANSLPIEQQLLITILLCTLMHFCLLSMSDRKGTGKSWALCEWITSLSMRSSRTIHVLERFHFFFEVDNIASLHILHFLYSFINRKILQLFQQHGYFGYNAAM